MIPDEITRAHLKRAIPQLALRGWPVRRRSTRYDLVDELHRVPPKEAVREAATVAGVRLGRFSGGDETNEFLRDRGFVVVGKNDVLLGVTPVQEADDRSFPEGAIIFRLHQSRERNGRAPLEAKRQRLVTTGDLACDVCGFSFVQAYGARGAGFIEAHHDEPLSQVRTRVRTRVEDLALVCSNCHRMLHRTRPWLRARELCELLRRERDAS